MSISLEKAHVLIVERARQLVSSLINVRGHDNPPFLSEEYARLLGIKNIERTNLGNTTSGMLLRFKDDTIIKVNQNHRLSRQNFSCAHEVGHILFSELKLENYTNTIEHRTFNPIAQQKARSVAIEKLCDAAAAELLMPEAIFRKYLLKFGVTISSVEKLSDIFQVSIRSVVRRIAELSVEPCIALVWQPLLKTNILHLVQCSGPGRKTIYSPVYKKVKYPSVLHNALKQNSLENCYKSFRIGTEIKRLPMESKGFGNGEFKCVVSLAFPER